MNPPLDANLPGPGTLALVGSGEYLLPMSPVDRYLLERLQESPRVVCLPTAVGADSDSTIQHWADLAEQHFRSLGVEKIETLRVIDRATAEDEAMAARIREANFVYLSSGMPIYLYLALNGTPVFAAIHSVLERGGVVAGCSAGAMVFGERIPGSALPWSWQEGFGYLPGAILLPNFDDLSAALLASFSLFAGKMTIIGVEDDTALVFTQDGCLVRGRGGVSIIQEGRRQRYVEE